MTLERRHVRFLASVTNESEARLAASCGADIIDCKNPSEGALGALPVEVVRAVRRIVPAAIPVSATIGDLPAEPEPVLAATRVMAETGVDYVKIGFFSGGDARATIAQLGEVDLGGAGLIGLLLADRDPDFSLIADMHRAGFRGVMVDTAEKDGRTLCDHMSADELRRFIDSARVLGLWAGLAGSLRAADIPPLAALSPDILGFRGALCVAHRRGAALDPEAIRGVRGAITEANRDAIVPSQLEPSL